MTNKLDTCLPYNWQSRHLLIVCDIVSWPLVTSVANLGTHDGARSFGVLYCRQYILGYCFLTDSQSIGWTVSVQEHTTRTSSDIFAFCGKSVELWWRTGLFAPRTTLYLYFLVICSEFDLVIDFCQWFYLSTTIHCIAFLWNRGYIDIIESSYPCIFICLTEGC